MKNLVAIAFAGMLLATACQAGSAMESMPTCSAGDPVVAVNTKTKMYMSMTQMKMMTKGMTMEQKKGMMMKHHVTMMCKSHADAMGGKMMMSKPM